MRFKIRCSAIGTLMAGNIGVTEKQLTRMVELKARRLNLKKPLTPNMKKELEELEYKNDNPQLPQGAKTYIEQWVKEQLYQRQSFKGNKFTDKGLLVEDESIDFVADVFNYPMLVKNEKHYANDYITGTPDIVLPEEVIDVKNSWDFSTFPIFNMSVPDKGYWWQGQGYMHLTGRTNYKLIYTLMDTPIHLVEADHRAYCFRNGYDVEDAEVWNKIIEQSTYSNIDKKLRYKAFYFEYSSQAIDEVISRVKLAQNYVDELLTFIGENDG